MAEITIKGLTFETYISHEEIAKQVERMAAEVKRDCVTDSPIFMCILKGAFVFASDFFRAINMPSSEIAFIRYKSYIGTLSTGEMNKIMGLNDNVTGKEVIILEDIVDTGLTSFSLLSDIQEMNPKSVKIAALLYKPSCLKYGKAPDYVGFEIPHKFIIGYGLDFDEKVRGLKEIYALKEQTDEDRR